MSLFRVTFRITFFHIALAAFLFLAVFFYYSSGYLESKGFKNTFDFLSTVIPNYFKGLSATPETLKIHIAQDDWDKIAAQRETHLQRGLIINDGTWFPATLIFHGKKLNAELRLKGHMTDHIAGEKWSFRIKVKGKGTFAGMKRFSVQHPGTRNYIYEWLYHQLLQKEDIISLRYFFITVVINGREKGIYAVEENFDEELLDNNQRPKGPIIRFNPDLYWIDRYNEMAGDHPVAEYASFQSSFIESFRSKKTLKDSVQGKYLLAGASLLEGFRMGTLTVSQVFDVARFAKFMAIIDLAGGNRSMDWSDLKFFYNPLTLRIEPVGYESFSANRINDIAGNYRFTDLPKGGGYSDFYKLLFSDTVFFSEYIRALEHVSKPGFLNSFFAKTDESLNRNLNILYSEFPYKKFQKDIYYLNQQTIRKIISPPKLIYAFFNRISGDSLFLDIGNLESLPVEITGLRINGTEAGYPVKPAFLASKQNDDFIRYKETAFVPNGLFQFSDSTLNLLKVQCRLPGARQWHDAGIFLYPVPGERMLKNTGPGPLQDIHTIEFFSFDDNTKSIFIKPGRWAIDATVIIPGGYTLIAGEGVRIDLKKSAQLISYSPLFFAGTGENPVVFESSDSSSGGVIVVNAGRRSEMKNVHAYRFTETDASMNNRGWTFYESDATVSDCIFGHFLSRNALTIIRSSFSLQRCRFENEKYDALYIAGSKGNITNCTFLTCKGDGLNLANSVITVAGIQIDSVEGAGIRAAYTSLLTVKNGDISNCTVCIVSSAGSSVAGYDIAVSHSRFGFAAYRGKLFETGGSMYLINPSVHNTGNTYIKDEFSSVEVNDQPVTAITNDIEKIINNAGKSK